MIGSLKKTKQREGVNPFRRIRSQRQRNSHIPLRMVSSFCCRLEYFHDLSVRDLMSSLPREYDYCQHVSLHKKFKFIIK